MKDEKLAGTVTYRMHVIARDAAELAVNAGGLIVDRMMSGWRVSVQLTGTGAATDAAPDVRSVQILGAELVDAAESQARQEDDQCVLVMGADAYSRAVSGDALQHRRRCLEVLVWGESPDPTHVFGHKLSAAARAFKALAVAAGDLAGREVAIAETFTSMNAKAGGVTLHA